MLSFTKPQLRFIVWKNKLLLNNEWLIRSFGASSKSRQHLFQWVKQVFLSPHRFIYFTPAGSLKSTKWKHGSLTWRDASLFCLSKIQYNGGCLSKLLTPYSRYVFWECLWWNTLWCSRNIINSVELIGLL